MSSFDYNTRSKMYNDIKNIISTYFANTSSQNLEEYHLEFDDVSSFFDTIKLNYNIFKLLELKQLLYKINDKLRRDITIKDVDMVNMIRGKLNIQKYIKIQRLSINTKKYFPCKVLSEEYDIIENRFLLMVVQYALNLVNDIPNDDKDFIKEFTSSGHWEKLSKLKKDLVKLLYSGDFKMLVEANIKLKSKELIKLINRDLPIVKLKLKRREIDSKTYGKIVEWWDSINSDLTNIDEIPLILYNTSFDDKLFELWLLEQIKNSFINEFGMRVLDIVGVDGKLDAGANPLWKRTKTHVYRLKYVNGNVEKILKIYFQKSNDLVWDKENKPRWIQIPKNINEQISYLYGNLDIVITCDDNKDFDPVLIDAKNIYYKSLYNGKEYTNPSVTDKVYKMVGYLDNFNKKVLCNNNGLGIILFKNRGASVLNEKEYISDSKNSYINIFSINPNIESTDMSIISDYILNHFGLLADRAKQIDYIRSTFINKLENLSETEIESKIQIIYEYISNSINVLTRGKEDEIEKIGKLMEFNMFGKDIWGRFEKETVKFLCQTEFLYNSFKECSNLEYSMFAINLAKAVENEVNEKFTEGFKNYLITSGITQHRYFVIDNLVNNKHLTIGQTGKLLKGGETILNDYFTLKIPDVSKRNLFISEIKKLGSYLVDFSEQRNLIAHKDGIGYEQYCDIRCMVLGIGMKPSLLKLISLFL